MPYESTKKKIFAVILLFVFGIIALIYLNAELLYLVFTNELFWLAALIVFFLFMVRYSDVPVLIKLKDYERAVIFRFGKFNRVGGPGWALLIPFIESYTRVDLRTKTLDIEKQDVITRDSIEIRIDTVIYLKVKKDDESVARSVLEVEDFQEASRTYVMSALRDIIGEMTLPEVIANIDKINKRLHDSLSEVAEKWGLNVIAVQIKDVDLPEVVLKAMHEQKAAVQERLARIERAEASKIEINAVKEATADLSDRALNYYYIKALEKISDGQSTKIIFPLQFTSLAQSISEKLSASEAEKLVPLLRKALELNVGKAVEKAKK
ncbi:MAG: SPFH domain-containing protein [Candidatus Diapherotrites archaeon]|nr:SPFH domain-containing protein [Candidatus Diapherotrites archaeon]